MGQRKSVSDTLYFDKKITDYSIDATGNIYVAQEGGSISKYSNNFDSLMTYSPTQVGNVRLLEAGGGLRIFAFYDFYQEYLLLNRFLTQPVLTKLSDSSLDFVEIATQSLDNNLWLVENTGFRLIKFNISTHKIELEISLSSIMDTSSNSLTYLREYQNQVFLIDEHSGIYLFDNLGNFTRKIPAKTSKCSFYGDNIFYVENNKVVQLNMYTAEKVIKILSNSKVKGVLASKNHLYYVQPKCIIKVN